MEYSDEQYLNISCYAGSDDYDLFTGIVNQGIDGHLEAFTKSKFEYQKERNRQHYHFHKNEMSILLRRLCEAQDKESNMEKGMKIENWISDIVLEMYGVDIYE